MTAVVKSKQCAGACAMGKSEVTGTTKVIHVPAFGGMLYVDIHIITDLLLLIVLVLNENIII